MEKEKQTITQGSQTVQGKTADEGDSLERKNLYVNVYLVNTGGVKKRQRIRRIGTKSKRNLLPK